MEFESFEWGQLAQVPATAGLYAWYLKPKLRQADLADPIQTKKNLLRLAAQLRDPSLRVSADGKLSKRFRGELEHAYLGSDSETTKLVESVFLDESKRSLLNQILQNSVPALVSPLYVGVTSNLVRRVEEHRSEILALKEQIKLPTKQSFAQQVVERSLPLNSLVLYCFPLSLDGTSLELDEAELRKTAEAAETILNRLFYPVLGRR